MQAAFMNKMVMPMVLGAPAELRTELSLFCSAYLAHDMDTECRNEDTLSDAYDQANFYVKNYMRGSSPDLKATKENLMQVAKTLQTVMVW